MAAYAYLLISVCSLWVDFINQKNHSIKTVIYEI